MIAIIDYGMGNLRSVEKALQHVCPDREILIASEPDKIRKASHVVFPGQGAMPDCMKELDLRNLRQAVMEAAENKPFLGICIGLQMLFEESEEGNTAGLGLIKGKVRRFPRDMKDESGKRLKVPHMGWNGVGQRMRHPLFNGIEDDSRFYFVHSYYVDPVDKQTIAAYTHYPFAFASAISKNNIFAVQFHPEKSQNAGLLLLKNFSRWDGNLLS